MDSGCSEQTHQHPSFIYSYQLKVHLLNLSLTNIGYKNLTTKNFGNFVMIKEEILKTTVNFRLTWKACPESQE